MPLEYEYVFRNYNKKKLIETIKQNGGYKVGHYIFKVMVFLHPLNEDGTYIRVRDEGHRITMTFKYTGKKVKFSDEHEIIIDNFDSAVNILLGVGCKTKYYYEKLREIWNIKNSEVVFDINPGIPERMEVESPTLKELDNLTKKLELLEYKINGTETPISDELYGFKIPTNIKSLTFINVKKHLLPLIKKNKPYFIDLVKKQKKIYTKILNSKK